MTAIISSSVFTSARTKRLSCLAYRRANRRIFTSLTATTDTGWNLANFSRFHGVMKLTTAYMFCVCLYTTGFRRTCCLVTHLSRTYRVEAILGASENAESLIQEYMTSNVATRETPGIIDCTYATTFWLSWADGYPTLGRGQ